jgi:hypothetical protein
MRQTCDTYTWLDMDALHTACTPSAVSPCVVCGSHCHGADDLCVRAVSGPRAAAGRRGRRQDKRRQTAADECQGGHSPAAGCSGAAPGGVSRSATYAVCTRHRRAAGRPLRAAGPCAGPATSCGRLQAGWRQFRGRRARRPGLLSLWRGAGEYWRRVAVAMVPRGNWHTGRVDREARYGGG